MKAKNVWLLLVFVAGMVSSTALCWAEETCYNYLIGYSYRDQVVYYTPIFTTESDGVSYNKEEYVSDTATSLKMESAFQKYLIQKMKVNSIDLTVSARVAYKTDEIAKNRMDKEVGDFRYRGFTIKEISAFKYDY